MGAGRKGDDWIAATFAVASLTLVFAGQSHATVFAAWQVANVLVGDTLNVRLWQNTSPILIGRHRLAPGRWQAAPLFLCDARQPVVLRTDVNNQDCRRDSKANQSIETCFVSYRECNAGLTLRQALSVWRAKYRKIT
ncbi:hypothetical protein [Mesorhizobium loti]|nr:hypothetical protein [Mesorhizobium loti]